MDGFENLIHHVPELVIRPVEACRNHEAAHHVGYRLVVDHPEHFSLAVEVIVQKSQRDAGFSGDHSNGCGIVAVLGEQLQ